MLVSFSFKLIFARNGQLHVTHVGGAGAGEFQQFEIEFRRVVVVSGRVVVGSRDGCVVGMTAAS